MELLFVFVIGAAIGFVARYALPGRHEHGELLVPAVAAGVAMLLWEALTWAGLAWNGGWIWIITPVASALAAVLVDVLVSRSRVARDAALEAELVKAGRAA